MGKILKAASKGGRPSDPVLALGRVADSKLAGRILECWDAFRFAGRILECWDAFRVAGRILECWDFSENLNGLQDLVAFEY